MPSVLRSVAAFAFVSAIAVLSAPGCSQQGEGQRCDYTKNGDVDCDDGLVCIKSAELANHLGDICCHEDPANDSKSRCARGAATGSGGKGGSGGASASAGAAGETSGGTPSETNGGTPGETNGGTGASGSPTTSDGGMSAAGTPAATDGGTAPVAGTGSQGGAG